MGKFAKASARLRGSKVRERLVTFPRAIAIAFKPITGCIQPF